MLRRLPKPPIIEIERKDNIIIPEDGFVRVSRSNVIFNYPDGTKSNTFLLDSIVRNNPDAVAIIAYFIHNNSTYIYLRSCIRPALVLRDYFPSSRTPPVNIGNHWEIPAGFIEKDEVGVEGVIKAAKRELEEELGFNYLESNFKHLGKEVYVAGSSADRIFYVSIKVDPSKQEAPKLDGEPFEYGGKIIFTKLEDILRAIEDGEIYDGKTEIGLNRFARYIDKVRR